MRILMLSEFYHPIVGGIEQYVRTLSVELAARGHEVSVVTSWQKGFPTFEIDQGVRIHRIRATIQRIGVLFSESERRYLPPSPDPEVMYALYQIILQERPDIVHAHDWMVHSFTLLKALSKAKLVVSLHGYSLSCVQKRLMRDEMRCSGPELRKCLDCTSRFYGTVKGPVLTLAHLLWSEKERRTVDMFLPVSQAVVEGNQLVKYEVPFQVIPNFVPDSTDITCDDMNPFLAQLPGEDFLLFVGDVTLDKGVAVLLHAYSEIPDHIPLVLIGRPILEGLSELPSNVFVMGIWPHQAVMQAWSRCSIAIVPSIVAETFGIVAIEAMSMGKPVVASNIGGLTDVVVNNETGFLVPSGDPEALREAIQCLLDNPVRREYMGDMAKQRVVKFHANTVVPCVEQVYQDMFEVNPINKHLQKSGN